MSEARILIVEDEAIEAMDLQSRLAHLGYPLPDAVYSGEDAIGKARETHLDLILMDIMLSGKIDGIQAAEQIRAFLDVPIIFLTAYADDKTLARAKITEPYAYIVKPFQEKELHIAIEMALYKHAAERKLRESQRHSEFLLKLTDTLKPLSDTIAIENTASRLLGEHLKADRVGYFKINGGDCVVERDYAPSVPHLSGRFPVAAFGQRLMSAYQTGRMVVMNNIAEEPLTLEERESYLGIQVQAQISMPLIKNGEFLGGMTVHSTIPRVWTPQEKWLLEETAERTWATIERKKAEEALAKANDELEIRVEERTRELALANEQLRQYSYRITQMQEEERKRVAYEMGEELAQTLSAIKLEADLMTQKVSSHVKSIRKRMGTVVQNAAAFGNTLRPSVLEHLGLPDALEAIIAEMNRNGEMEIVLNTNGSQRRLPEEMETALFRIAQEALNNIVRHSGATKAKVNVGFLKTGIKFTIIDNGKGFETEGKTETAFKDDPSLFSMRERARQIGGELEMKSELGKGTTITVTVPIQSKKVERCLKLES